MAARRMGERRLGESQGRILDYLKRQGSGTIPPMADALDLSVETVRWHLKALVAEGLVLREGSRVTGPGRPEIVYGLADAAETWFPSKEDEILRELAAFLKADGRDDLLRRFFDQRVSERRGAALRRVEGLTGEDRLREVVRILAEEGFMPALDEDEAGRPVLRLTHCPLRGLVDVTRAPCRAELGFIRELLGATLARISYIPAGDSACCYALDAAS